MPQALRSSIVVIAIAAAALGGTACRFAAENPAAPPSSRSESASSAVGSSNTGTVEGTATMQPLNRPEAAELEAELNAIEKELDSMDLPSDSDFKDIEGDL